MLNTEFYQKVENELVALGFELIKWDRDRPWGAFYYINEDQAQKFADYFFDGINIDSLKIAGKLSPKILIVLPGKKLSWQYHHRRAEIWQVYKGTVGIVQSESDLEGEIIHYNPGSKVILNQGVRHRLIGLDDFGVVAEIWQHTETIPSDEDDIVRVQDDYNRK